MGPLTWASGAAQAADECGAVAPGGTATCTPAGNPYTSGVFYMTPGVTVVVQHGVVIDTNLQDGVGIESTGNLTITTNGNVSVRSTGFNRDGLRADTQNGGNVVVTSTADIVVTNAGGDGIIARSNNGAVGNGLGTGTVSVSSSGRIEVFGNVATGISAGGSGLFTSVTVSGDVTTHGLAQSPALFVVNRAVNPLAKAEVNVLGATLSTSGSTSPGIAVNTLVSQAIVKGSGSIATTGLSSQGIGVLTATGAVNVQWDGLISTQAQDAAGIRTLNQTAGDATITAAGEITTIGAGSDGILSATANGVISITSSANIRTIDFLSRGIVGQAVQGTVSITSHGAITTMGTNSTGIAGISGNGGVSIASNGPISTTGDLSFGIATNAAGAAGSSIVESNASITTTGAQAQGIAAAAAQASKVNVRSGVNAQGAFSVGAYLTSEFSTADLFIAQDAAIMGGWQADVASLGPNTAVRAGGVVIGGNVAAGDPAALVTNQGVIGAWSDRAITSADQYALSPPGGGVQVENHGTITGFVEFSSGTNLFNNYSSNSFNIRHFADTNGDLVRDTERVAISTFGGGIFDSKATGTVRLVTVPNMNLASLPPDPAGPTAWDLTGATYVPAGVDTSVHDITRPGVEQGQLLTLSRFINAGIITMMDAETGGAGPVVGDLLIVSGGSTAGVPGGGVFESAGGQLRLDTVLNEGGAASRSDILVVDGTVVTSGATRIFVANSGGAGGQTVGDGIKLVDVLTPAASSPGAFVLGQRVGAGAWEYLLFHGGVADPSDGDWYLRNELRVETQVYTTVPILAHELGFWLMGTYHERMGDPLRLAAQDCRGRSIKDPDVPQGIAVACGSFAPRSSWGRVMAGTGEFSPRDSAESRFDRQGLQAGHDVLQRSSDGAHESAGFYVTAGQLTTDVRSAGAKIGSSEIDAYGVGVYWTRLSPSGWYVDAVGQALWSDVEAASTLGARISTDAVALAASIEAGYGLRIGSGVVLEPQAQLIYQVIDLDATADSMGQVTFGSSDQLRGRLGLRLSRVWTDTNALQTALWGRVNVWHDFLSGPSTTFASLSGTDGLAFGIEDRGTYSELQLGVTAQVARSVSLYGQGSWGTSLDGEASRDFGGQVGIKIAW